MIKGKLQADFARKVLLFPPQQLTLQKNIEQIACHVLLFFY